MLDKDDKSRLLYFLAALGALLFALLSMRDTGWLRLVYGGLAVACTVKAFALKADPGYGSPRAPGPEEEFPATQGPQAPGFTRDRAYRGIGRLVVWVVLGPFILVAVFTAGWAALCIIRGSCG